MLILRRDIPANYFAEHGGHPGIQAAQASYNAWHSIALEENWLIPQDIKASHPKASILKAGRVVFNIKGNNYRLFCKVNYGEQIVEVRWFGSHSEYDDIDADSI